MYSSARSTSLSFRPEALLRVQHLRRTERTAVERFLKRCVDVAGIALDIYAIPRPQPLDLCGRPPCEILDVEAIIEKRSSIGPTMWNRRSQPGQRVLKVLVPLIGRELLELGLR